MKILLLSILSALMFFFSCKSSNKELPDFPGILSFETGTIRSNGLAGEVSLEGNTGMQELLLRIKLRNQSKDSIIIENIGIETLEGYQSKLTSAAVCPFTLACKTETEVSFTYKPVNDFEYYLLTGESGKFRQQYRVSIGYRIDQNMEIATNTLKASATDFYEYEKTYRQTVFAVKFNTQPNFVEEQKKYISSMLKTSSFVHLSEPEVTIAGLNFRLQAKIYGDSIYAELFVVNHAMFPVKINRDAFDIIADLNLPGESKSRRVETLSNNPEVLERGDRAVLSKRKYLRYKKEDTLKLLIRNVFLLPDNMPLFYTDMSLKKE